ncbi:hypothetical protein HK405_003304, partial [Cladochytrium tenue]
CTRTGSGRALCNSKVYSRDGTLVFSCAQEGAVRFSANPRPPGLLLELASAKGPGSGVSETSKVAAVSDRDRTAVEAKAPPSRL